MPKIDLPIEQAARLLAPGPVTLVTSAYRDRVNVLTVGWVSVASFRPVLVSIAIFPGTFSHDLIRSSGEFVINIPPWDIVRQVRYCGRVSGREVDKFAASGLRPEEPRYVRAPHIEQCIGHLECAVVEAVTPGDHTLFIGEVVAARVEEDLFDGYWLIREERDLRPLHHLGGDFYGVLAERTAIREGEESAQG